MTRVVAIQTSAGIRPRRSDAVVRLMALERGEKLTLTYSRKTPFAVWIAIQRERLGRQFKWEKCKNPHSNKFVVWLESPPRKRKAECGTPSHCPHDITRIDWGVDKLAPAHSRIIIDILCTYRFAPRQGHGGGLMSKACKDADVPYHVGWRLLKELLENTKLLQRSDRLFRRLLRSFVEAISESGDAWLHQKVFDALKVGDRVQITLNARQHGLLSTCLSRLQKDHRVTIIDSGPPPTFLFRGIGSNRKATDPIVPRRKAL